MSFRFSGAREKLLLNRVINLSGVSGFIFYWGHSNSNYIVPTGDIVLLIHVCEFWFLISVCVVGDFKILMQKEIPFGETLKSRLNLKDSLVIKVWL